MRKKIGILLLTGVLFGSSVLNVQAGVVQPKGTCPYCYSFFNSFCDKNYFLYLSGEHKPLFKDPCFARYYRSYGGYKCMNLVCEEYGYIGSAGWHECKEEHESCGLGTYNVCGFNGGVLPTVRDLQK